MVWDGVGARAARRTAAELFGIRRTALVRPRRDLPHRPVAPGPVVVVGGGVAGVSAAVVLAERGVPVTVLERSAWLGGRLAAWPRRGPDGSVQMVGHGFHAFFRHYYTLRSVLARVESSLSFLQTLERYPVLSRRWPAEDFGRLPPSPPWSLLALLARSPSIRLTDLPRIDRRVARQLFYDPVDTVAELDDVSARTLLDRVGLPQRARAMLFEVFARSFFSDQAQLSAAELVAMFHFYFLGNPEGLTIEAPVDDYATCLWQPLRRYLDGLGAQVRTGCAATELVPGADATWSVRLSGGERLRARHVVLATHVPGLVELVGRSPALAVAAPRLAGQVARASVAAPYAVTRLWLDRDLPGDPPAFAAVTGEPTLDSVTWCHRLEAGSRAWAARTGGAVLELHSYATDAPDAATATARMRAELAALWPRTRAARVLDLVERVERHAPAFGVGGHRQRPGVLTDARGVRLAGDWLRLPFCAGLMERAAMSGVLAANDILAEEGAAAEPVDGVPCRSPFRRPAG